MRTSILHLTINSARNCTNHFLWGRPMETAQDNKSYKQKQCYWRRLHWGLVSMEYLITDSYFQCIAYRRRRCHSMSCDVWRYVITRWQEKIEKSHLEGYKFRCGHKKEKKLGTYFYARLTQKMLHYRWLYQPRTTIAYAGVDRRWSSRCVFSFSLAHQSSFIFSRLQKSILNEKCIDSRSLLPSLQFSNSFPSLCYLFFFTAVSFLWSTTVARKFANVNASINSFQFSNIIEKLSVMWRMRC